MSLSAHDLEHYRREGWLAPIDVMSPGEAAVLGDRLAMAEAEFPDELHAEHRNNAHLAFPFLADLALRPTIVDAVASIVGHDVTLWSSVLFIKEPDSSAFVSWHQDAFYMGLEPDNFVTAWIALTPSTPANGCVSVIPGTHRHAVDHHDTFDADNILTRGQEIASVDASAAVHLELRPGQMSLHHPWLVHGSQPNCSDERRVGVAMQSYLGADVRPTRGIHHVMHVQGAPVPTPFMEAARPTAACTAAGRAARAAANAAFADILYDGAERRRSL